MAGNIIDSLLVALGFQVDDTALDEFQEKVADARQTMLSIAATAGAAAAGVGVFVTKMAEGIDELADFADREQVAIGFLQELGHAAQLEGSSLEAVRSSVQGVNRVLGEAIIGLGRGAMAFEKLGLQARNADGSIKSVDELLGEVAERMQGMSRQEAIAMAEKLGIDRSLIPLLMKGRDALEKYREEARALGVSSEEDAANAGALTDALDRTKFMMGAMARTVAVELMPRITEVIDGFRKWVLESREIIRSSIGATLTVLSTIIGRLWEGFRGMIGAITDAVRWLGQFEVVVYAAAAAMAVFVAAKVGFALQAMVTLIRSMTVSMMAFNASALLIPAIIGAIAIAIGLLVDDFLTFKEGGDSVIGGLVEKFPMLGDVILAVEDLVRGFFDWFAGTWNLVGPPLMHLIDAVFELSATIVSILWPLVRPVLLGFIAVIGALGFAFVNLVGLIVRGAAHIVGFLTSVVGSFVAGITAVINGVGSAIDWVVDAVMSGAEKVLGFVDKAISAAKKVGQFLGFGDSDVSVSLEQSSASTVKTEQPGRAKPGRTEQPGAKPGRAGQPGAKPERARPAAATPDRQGRAGGVIGKAADVSTSTSSTTNNTDITAPITIVTNDPARAGASVRDELARVNRQAARNGRTAVQL